MRGRRRRLPVGAEPCRDGKAGADFRVWAPQAQTLDVVLDDGATTALQREPGGYFSGVVSTAGAGTRYRYRLDRRTVCADPASRYQPEGVRGPSQVVDSTTFSWTDAGWSGIGRGNRVIYELHVGTFTREGTWAAAARELPQLAADGVDVIEMMPVAEFPGEFGWGYDGVFLFAPTRLYGAPDDLRRFVDRAHGVGIGVILDVVYNHLGPDGCVLRQYAAKYFTDRYANEWGDAINFDGEGAAPVREFFTANAAYWIDEFHLDGLRVDATQQMFDASDEHVLGAIARAARAAAGTRNILLVAENEPQHVLVTAPWEHGGYGFDALWNDDFHHTARVALTGRREAYYLDYAGRPQEVVSAVKRGFLYQGQHYAWQNKARGTPTRRVPASAFVGYLENHDQVANSARGTRLHALSAPGCWRALTAVLLLGPAMPMLFQGQEFAASAPFLYFADHHAGLARLVRKGRTEFLQQFPSIATAEVSETLPDPGDRATFERCKLNLSERERHPEAYALHRDLLRLRRDDPVFAAQGAHGVDGAVLGDAAFVLRFFGEADDDRLLIVDLGMDLGLDIMPEPLLAPPIDARWTLLWSSEHPRYGGGGAVSPVTNGPWTIRGQSAVVLHPERTAA